MDNFFYMKQNECESCGRFDEVIVAVKPYNGDIFLMSTFSSLDELENIIEKNKPILYSLHDSMYFPIYDAYNKEYTFEQFKNLFTKEAT